MKLQWTIKAENDLYRLHDFLEKENAKAANKIVRQLVSSVGTLEDHPRLGVRLTEFLPQEVRRIIVRDYEIRYIIDYDTVTILRLWHTKEDR